MPLRVPVTLAATPVIARVLDSRKRPESKESEPAKERSGEGGGNEG